MDELQFRVKMEAYDREIAAYRNRVIDTHAVKVSGKGNLFLAILMGAVLSAIIGVGIMQLPTLAKMVAAAFGL